MPEKALAAMYWQHCVWPHFSEGAEAIREVATLQWELMACLSGAFGERTCLCVVMWGPNCQVLPVQLTSDLPL